MKFFKHSLFFFFFVSQFCSAQWYLQNSGTTAWLHGVWMIDSSKVIAVGSNGAIIKTNNAGTTWESKSSGSTAFLNSICFFGSEFGTAVGEGGIILQTTDGGETWNQRNSGTTANLWAVTFIQSDLGLIVGEQGKILLTNDGGFTWENLWISMSDYFYDAVIPGYLTAFVTGIPFAAGPQEIVRTTDGGLSWETLFTGTTDPLYAIAFKDSTTGFVAGQNGLIMITTDSGDSWLSQNSGITSSIYDIQFIGDNSIIAIGDNGKILITTNMGTNWSLLTSGTNLQLSSVSFSNRNNGTIVGYVGTILRTTNGGVSFVEEELIDEVPTEFLLSQNYPNPFNPSTKIKYSIPTVGIQCAVSVQIKVYDILGNEIATLVSEEKPAGTYEVKFNAVGTSRDLSLTSGVSAKGGYASGIYFYQIRAGSFVETKKMLLLK